MKNEYIFEWREKPPSKPPERREMGFGAKLLLVFLALAFLPWAMQLAGILLVYLFAH
jgi:hypothetical protein